MELGKYEYCSETSSPTHSADEQQHSHNSSPHSGHHHSSTSSQQQQRHPPHSQQQQQRHVSQVPHTQQQPQQLSHHHHHSSNSSSQSQLIMTTPEGLIATSGTLEQRGEAGDSGNNNSSNRITSATSHGHFHHGHQHPRPPSSAQHDSSTTSSIRPGNCSSGGGGSSDNDHSGFMSQYERNLNFATVALDDGDYGYPKKKTVRDPLSHRIIEKRRRDRMNNCLADLARLLPQASLRKGRGRIEKTEIVELAIKHLQHLQTHPCPHGDNCEYSPLVRKGLIVVSTNLSAHSSTSSSPVSPQPATGGLTNSDQRCLNRNEKLDAATSEGEFRHGYQECLNETMHFLVERKRLHPGDGLCLQLVTHLTEQLNMKNDHDLGHKSSSRCSDISETERSFRESRAGIELEHSKLRRVLDPTLSSISAQDEIHQDEDKHSTHQQKHSSPPISSKSNDGNHNSNTTRTKCSTATEEAELMDQRNANNASADNDDLNSGKPSSATNSPIALLSTSPSSSANNSSNNKNPVIPTIICTNSTSPNNRESPINESHFIESADEGSSASNDASHNPCRYKFKSSIKQRFTADLQTYSPTNNSKDKDPDHLNPQSQSETNYTNRSSPNSFRRSNNSSRNSNISELDDEQDLVLQKISSHSSPSETVGGIRVKSPVQFLRDSVANDDNGKVQANRKSSTPQPPLVSVVKMSTLIESEDESLEQQLQKNKRDELFGASAKSPKLLTTPEFNPINLCKNKSSPVPLTHQPEDEGVPIFALAEEGQYYIPLTIGKSILKPFSSEFEEHEHGILKNPKYPLYPVTISVCFAQSKSLFSKNSSMGREKELKYIPPLPTRSEQEMAAAFTKARKECNLVAPNPRNMTQLGAPPVSSPQAPGFNTITDIEFRRRCMNTNISQSANMLTKYQQHLIESESEPELSISRPYPLHLPQHLTTEEACLRKYQRISEHENSITTGRSSAVSDRNSSSTGGGCSVPFSAPNYLYPILLGACTPKTYNSRTAASNSSSSGARNTNTNTNPSHSQSLPYQQARTPESTNSSTTASPILRKRCNPSTPPKSLSPHHRYYTTSSSSSYPVASFHPEFQRTSASDVSDTNNSSRNSSPIAAASSSSTTNLRTANNNKYNIFLEANQLWNANEGEFIENGMLKAHHHRSATIDPRLLDPRSTSKLCNESTNSSRNNSIRGSSSPKRQKKDTDDSSHSIPKIITLK